MSLRSIFISLFLGNFLVILPPAFGATLKKRLLGRWTLTQLTCAGKDQKLSMKYELTFDRKNNGEYISTTPTCVQHERESYIFKSPTQVAIKQGLRICDPNPCDADLPKSECGKETNPNVPVFDVALKDGDRIMTLSTSDPNSIDCTAEGQSKPAVFTFTRQ
jgi:hypothetical protein